MAKGKAYLDNASTSPMLPEALEEYVRVSNRYYGNASSLHHMGREAKELLSNCREIISRELGAEEGSRIIFTSGGTESNNLALRGVRPDDPNMQRLLISEVEHDSILNTEDYWHYFKEIPVKSNCVIDERYLESALRISRQEDVGSLCSIQFCNNETGVLQPILKVAALCKKYNYLLHVDAVQAVGKDFINVSKMGIDMLSASAHKFGGPKGVGFLYLSPKGIERYSNVILTGGGQEFGIRSGTENVPGIAAMTEALEESNAKREAVYFKHTEWIERLLNRLQSEKILFELNGEQNLKCRSILNIRFNGIVNEMLVNMLDTHDCFISTSSACSGNRSANARSHVLEAMGLNHQHIDESVRISLGSQTTEEEWVYFMDSLIAVIHNIQKYLKKLKRVS